ncbi:MAG: hypothetical protein N2379_10100, partial [Verrucomicrobiae bacterium]|nr:hypothetical protein [Verrucomicrobiae bacterium]
IKAARAGEKVVDAARAADKVQATASAAQKAEKATAKPLEGASDLRRAQKIAEATARGRAAESRVLKEMGLPKNKLKVVGREGESVPDYITKDALGDMKGRKVVTDSPQLRIQREAAKDTGKTPEVVTGVKTRVSETVLRESHVIRRHDLGPQ